MFLDCSDCFDEENVAFYVMDGGDRLSCLLKKGPLDTTMEKGEMAKQSNVVQFPYCNCAVKSISV
jgi:hypothetical protein